MSSGEGCAWSTLMLSANLINDKRATVTTACTSAPGGQLEETDQSRAWRCPHQRDFPGAAQRLPHSCMAPEEGATVPGQGAPSSACSSRSCGLCGKGELPTQQGENLHRNKLIWALEQEVKKYMVNLLKGTKVHIWCFMFSYETKTGGFKVFNCWGTYLKDTEKMYSV